MYNNSRKNRSTTLTYKTSSVSTPLFTKTKLSLIDPALDHPQNGCILFIFSLLSTAGLGPVQVFIQARRLKLRITKTHHILPQHRPDFHFIYRFQISKTLAAWMLTERYRISEFVGDLPQTKSEFRTDYLAANSVLAFESLTCKLGYLKANAALHICGRNSNITPLWSEN